MTAFLTFLSLWYPLIGFLVVAIFYIWYFRNVNKRWNSPEMIAERQKAAYEEAHAYTKGKCCCGRN